MGFAIAQYVTPEYLERRSKQDGECRVWTKARNSRRYGHFNVMVNGKTRTVKAHRAAYAVHKGVEPEGLEVMHSCDNPLCINPAHLSLGTHDDNMADMKRKGRAVGHPREQNPNVKITPDQLAAIRSAPKVNGVNQVLAAQYGLNSSYVSQLRSGRHWGVGELS